MQAIVALVNLFLYYNDIHTRHKIVTPVFLIIFCSVLVYLVRTGSNWVKYFFLIGFAFVNGKPANWVKMFTHGPLRAGWAIMSIAISIWVIWLLFTIPSQQVSNKKGPDNPGPEIV